MNVTRSDEQVPVNGGAITFITPEALAQLAETGSTTVGVPQPVNGTGYGEAHCPDCDGGAA